MLPLQWVERGSLAVAGTVAGTGISAQEAGAHEVGAEMVVVVAVPALAGSGAAAGSALGAGTGAGSARGAVVVTVTVTGLQLVAGDSQGVGAGTVPLFADSQGAAAETGSGTGTATVARIGTVTGHAYRAARVLAALSVVLLDGQQAVGAKERVPQIKGGGFKFFKFCILGRSFKKVADNLNLRLHAPRAISVFVRSQTR